MVLLESCRKDSENDLRYQVVSIGEKIKYGSTLSWKSKYGRRVTENSKSIRDPGKVNERGSIFFFNTQVMVRGCCRVQKYKCM